MHKARDELLKHRTRLLSWKCDSLLCKSSEREKNFDMHNESLFMCLFCCLIFSFVMLCGSQHAFSLKHNLHTHTSTAQARGWKDSCCFTLLFPSRGPGKRRKIKWLNMLFCFAYEYRPLPRLVFIQWFYLFNFVPRAIPSIAGSEWETSSTSQTCNATEI